MASDRVQPGPAAQAAKDRWLAANPNYARRLTDPLLGLQDDDDTPER